MCWTDIQFIEWAEEWEPQRIPFWLKYYDDYVDACRAVADNPSGFDHVWEEAFPDPETFKKTE